MKIGILHITDIHFNENTKIEERVPLIKNICLLNFIDCEAVFILVTGDIANAGLQNEYVKAYSFFNTLLTNIAEIDSSRITRIVIVPGNHDCNFLKNDQVREVLIKSLTSPQNIFEKSFEDQILKVQIDFWEFYKKFNNLPENRIYFEIAEKIKGKVIKFQCFNTAWASLKKEIPGELYFPTQQMQISETPCDLAISLYHHPSNWMNPKSENNSKQFQLVLDQISSIQFVGHEHRQSAQSKFDLDLDTNSLIINGMNFNHSNNSINSGFITVKTSLEEGNSEIKSFRFQTDHYVLEKEYTYKIKKKDGKKFKLADAFIDKLERINIPIKIEKNDIKLSDIFIYPDLEKLGSEGDSIDEYVDSSKLLNESNFTILDGDSQCGKSSLLQIIFLKLYGQGLSPIWLNGKDIKYSSTEGLVKLSFKNTYSSEKVRFEEYTQLSKEEKVFIIDDFHLISISPKDKSELLKNLANLFDKVIISVDRANSIIPLFNSSFSKFNNYRIKSFGFKKTNDLIERYFELKNSDVSDNDKIDVIKSMFDKLRSIMGDELIPSFPIYLLSIIQSIDSNVIDLKETSSAYCYQALITMALLNKTGVPKDEIGTYFNFLKHFSFFIFQKQERSVTDSEFQGFLQSYKNTYTLPERVNILKNLIKAKILNNETGNYKFSYKYIYFYLVAGYLADSYSKDETKNIINNLLEELHLDENANILVFIAHHSKDSQFFEESVYAIMKPFENINPISLEKNCVSFSALNEITTSIADDVIDHEKKPFEERNRILIEQDKVKNEISRNKTEQEIFHDEVTNLSKPFFQSYHLIEIVGQIIKNQKGSLTTKELVMGIIEIYKTGFRSISSFSSILNSEKEQFTNELIEKFEQDRREKFKDKKWIQEKTVDTDKLRKRIKVMFNIMQFEACLAIFSKIIFSVGLKDYSSIYNLVSKEIGTPAAKLVSFSINSYFNKINVDEVEKLAKEFENNFVASFILKARVKSYIYSNIVDRTVKQKLASILKMKFIPQAKSKS